MPSMRKCSRVFGACILRSGRRLSTEPHEATKNARTDHTKTNWAHLLEDFGGGCKETRQENESDALEDVRMDECVEEVEVEVRNVDMMYGIVYGRKRKRDESGKMVPVEDRWFGKKFYRRKWRKKSSVASWETCADYGSCRFRYLAIVVDGPPCEYAYLMTCFLATVLSYMSRGRIGMRWLSKFLVSKPIVDAYSSCGVRFLQDFTTAKSLAICIISESKSSSPLFSLNFTVIPSFFMHMQTSLYLRSQDLFPFLHPFDIIYKKDEKVSDESSDKTDEPQHTFQIPSTVHHDFIAVEESQVLSRKKDLFSHPSLGVTKSSLRSFKSRNIRHIKKSRSNLRRKTVRPPSGFRDQKSIDTLAAGFLRIRQESVQLSPNAKNTKDLKFKFTQDMFTTGCSVNLLTTEPDRCYREEGATITLETSPSKQWFLSITKDEAKKYSFSAEKVIRPYCTNRFSHAVIWGIDSGFKLEFFDRRDWLIFKELYKECYDRNILSPAASVIHVPCVQEVLGLFSTGPKVYERPISYITVKDDELTRALVKKSANYDMDSDDEVWLEKLNDELCEGVEVGTCVTHDSFELIIDAFEKRAHCNPEENFEEQVFCVLFMHLERSEVVEAIHGYWVKKRKQNRAALLKVFQLYQPRRMQVIPNLVLRKKRSFKRQASHAGRGKNRPFFHAEGEALEQQNLVQKFEEAKAAAGRFEELAILKRQKAQMLMANADLATYKALVALRIAEGAQVVGGSGVAEHRPSTIAGKATSATCVIIPSESDGALSCCSTSASPLETTK